MRSDVAESAKKNKLDLNAPTLVAGAGATVTMSVLGSFLGPLGTVTGAALTSVTTAVITAVYKHTATVATEKAKQATFDRLKYRYENRVTPLSEAERVEVIAAGQEVLDAKRERSNLNRPKLILTGAAVAAGLFGGVMLVETGAEAVAGKPVASIVQGKPGNGTTLGGGRVEPTTTPTDDVTPAPSDSATPTQPGQRNRLVTPSTPPTGVVPPAPPTLPLTSAPLVPSQRATTAPPQGGTEPSNE